MLRHELNPALQPDSGYATIPLLGGTSIRMQSTIALDDILFDNGNGGLNTFMSKGTISKADLMDKVGNGVKTNADAKLTLLSLGKKLDENRYVTAGMSIRAKAKAWIPKGLFDCMKDIENRDYNIGKVRANATTYAELAAGASMKMNKRLTVGTKAKLLIGLMNADVKIDELRLNTLSDDQWTAYGNAEANVAGLKYKIKEKEYDSRPGTYQQVNGVNMNGLKPNGIGLAVDLGMTYKTEERWTVSAAITDLGFIAWTGNNRARNKETSFVFNGFHDVEVDKGEENSLKNQWDRMKDDLMDLAHLEKAGHSTHMQMISATFTAAAEYDMKDYANTVLGAMVTHKMDGENSWTEIRMTGNYISPTLPLNVAVSPAISTFGVSLGAMATYSPSKKTTIFIGSDHLFFKVNPQMIPTEMNGNVSLGMTIML